MGTPKKKSAESFVKDIRNNTRRIFTAEQKILIVMEFYCIGQKNHLYFHFY